jgi:lipoprotein LprG
MSPARTLIAASVACGLIAGCSSPSNSSVEVALPDAATLLQQSSQVTKGLESAHVEIAVQGKVENLPVKTLSGDLTNVPASAVQANATIIIGGADVDAEFVVVDATLYAALSPDNWLDMGPAAEIYDPSIILNPDSGVANMLNDFADPKAEEVEQIGGVDTVRVTGQVSADTVNKLIPRLKVTAPMPGMAWIEKDGDHKLVQARLSPTDTTFIQMTLSDWNKPVTVTKPQV